MRNIRSLEFKENRWRIQKSIRDNPLQSEAFKEKNKNVYKRENR